MQTTKLSGSVMVLVAALMGGVAFAQDATTAAPDAPQAGDMGPGAMGQGMGMPPMFDFATLDTDKDGKITKAELEAAKAARFAAMDSNSDGKVSAEEMLAAREKMRAEREAAMMTRMIAKFDKDGDGMLSAAEMPTPRNGDKMIDRIDTDKDGAISQAEADAAKKMMQERMADRGGKDRHGKGGHGKDGHGMRGHGGFMGMFGDDAPADQGN
ncbi:MAG: EF-hand domain-containing protein [Cypionkella sp.]